MHSYVNDIVGTVPSFEKSISQHSAIEREWSSSSSSILRCQINGRLCSSRKCDHCEAKVDCTFFFFLIYSEPSSINFLRVIQKLMHGCKSALWVSNRSVTRKPQLCASGNSFQFLGLLCMTQKNDWSCVIVMWSVCMYVLCNNFINIVVYGAD